METGRSTAGFLPGPWEKMLDNIRAILKRVEEQAAVREAMLTSPPAEVARAGELPPRTRHAGTEGLDRLERELAKADAALCAAEETLRGWSAAAGEIRRKLANGGPGSV